MHICNQINRELYVLIKKKSLTITKTKTRKKSRDIH